MYNQPGWLQLVLVLSHHSHALHSLSLIGNTGQRTSANDRHQELSVFLPRACRTTIFSRYFVGPIESIMRTTGAVENGKRGTALLGDSIWTKGAIKLVCECTIHNWKVDYLFSGNMKGKKTMVENSLSHCIIVLVTLPYLMILTHM